MRLRPRGRPRRHPHGGGAGCVTVAFADRGVPYDPLAKAGLDVTLPAEGRQIGGPGIFLVKRSMDAMAYEYRGGQNILRIRKKTA